MASSVRLKIFLLLSFALLFGSLQSQNLIGLMPFSEGVTEDILYETEIRFKDFRFSGLFAVKSDSNGYHIYLMSKTGFTLVEAILKNNETVWIKTTTFLDKEHRKQQLDTDLRLLTQSPLKFGTVKKKTKNGFKIKLMNGEKAFLRLKTVL